MKTLIGMPSVGTIPVEVISSLVNIRVPERSFMFTRRQLVHIARNMIVDAAVAKNHDYLLFIDDDMVVQPESFERLLAHDVDIVMAAYPRRSEPDSVAAIGLDGNKMSSVGLLGKDLVEVAGCGMGLTLIKRKVFETLYTKYAKMPFDFQWIEENGIKTPYGEDITFCHRARQEGFRCWVDLTLRPVHIGSTMGLQFNPKP